MDKRHRRPSQPFPSKRLRSDASTVAQDGQQIKLTHRDYSVGWVCALHVELAMSRAVLDESHETLPNKPGDSNAYTFGAIDGHNIAIACLPSNGYGTSNAAIVASNMSRSFPNIRFQLVVGIGAGVPCADSHDVRLGDVVVGDVVVQHDLGKAIGHGQRQLVDLPTKPPSEIQTAITQLRATQKIQETGLSSIIAQIPDPRSEIRVNLDDWLFSSNYPHVGLASACDLCDKSFQLPRVRRQSAEPFVHYGTIASGNQVIKDSQERDGLVRMVENTMQTIPPVLCLEMEAAGLKDNIPHLVIRGVCDYADSHKNKSWQPYAAASAAAYAKQLLSHLPKRHKHRDGDLDFSNKAHLNSHDKAIAFKQARKSILHKSLHFEQLESRYEDIELRHVLSDGCRWLLSTPEYCKWQDTTQLDQHGGFLWIKGKPGAGKSTTVKFLHDNKEQNMTRDDETVVAFFFNARGSELERSTAGMYRSLCFQLLQHFSDLRSVLLHVDTPIADDLIDTIGTAEDKALALKVPKWSLKLARQVFSAAISRLNGRHLSIFIDALDECDDDDALDMVETFENLGRVANKTKGQLYICFSSRYYPNISTEIGIELRLEEQEGHDTDMKNYVTSKLHRFPGGAARQIISQITQKASGVFLWVVLVIKILSKEIKHGRVYKLQQKLHELPPKLSDLFEEIVLRDEEERETLLLSLQLILHAFRPMSPQEFYFAAISSLSPSSLTEWDPDYVTLHDIRLFIVGSTKGLAEVTRTAGFPTVQFIHQSVTDFLARDNGLSRLFPELDSSTLHSKSHDLLRSCCETYWRWPLAQMALKGLPPVETLDQKYPFLSYATTFLLIHADEAAQMLSQDAFLRRFQTCKLRVRPPYSLREAVAYLEADPVRRTSPDGVDDNTGNKLNLRYLLASHNLSRLLSLLLDIDPNPSTDNPHGYGRLLIAAISNKAPETANILIGRGADLEARDEQGRTPLYISSLRGLFEVMWAVLDLGANINAVDDFGNTTLMHSVQKGNVECVQWAVQKGADINASNWLGETALYFAIQAGKQDIVKLLLKFGAEPNTRREGGETPLHLAAANCDFYAIEALLDAGADANLHSVLWVPPLQSLCAYIVELDEGRKAAIRLLLDRGGADINAVCGEYGTVLQTASCTSCDSTVLFLLDHGAEINLSGGDYGNALQAACASGRNTTVALLLSRGANVNAEGGKYMTALQAARQNDHEDIVNMLLEAGAVE